MRDIVRDAEFLQARAEVTDRGGFLANDGLKRAFFRNVEVIGEATREVPEATRAEFPEFEWRTIAGTRDRLIHDYGKVGYLIVWDVGVNKAAGLA